MQAQKRHNYSQALCKSSTGPVSSAGWSAEETRQALCGPPILTLGLILSSQYTWPAEDGRVGRWPSARESLRGTDSRRDELGGPVSITRCFPKTHTRRIAHEVQVRGRLRVRRKTRKASLFFSSLSQIFGKIIQETVLWADHAILKWTLSKYPSTWNKQCEPRFGYRGRYRKPSTREGKCRRHAGFPWVKVHPREQPWDFTHGSLSL